MSAVSGPRRQGRSVPALFGAVTVGLVLAVAALALVVRQPPPPALAEYAPDPQTIEESRQEQAAPGPEGECVGAECAQASEASTESGAAAEEDGPRAVPPASIELA